MSFFLTVAKVAEQIAREREDAEIAAFWDVPAPLRALREHVTGAVNAGLKTAIVEVRS